jgi:hypothetical protein
VRFGVVEEFPEFENFNIKSLSFALDAVSKLVGAPIHEILKSHKTIELSKIFSDIFTYSASICPFASISIVSTPRSVGGVESTKNASELRNDVFHTPSFAVILILIFGVSIDGNTKSYSQEFGRLSAISVQSFPSK